MESVLKENVSVKKDSKVLTALLLFVQMIVRIEDSAQGPRIIYVPVMKDTQDPIVLIRNVQTIVLPKKMVFVITHLEIVFVRTIIQE